MYLTRQTEIAIGILTICGTAPSRKVQTRYLAARVGTSKDHAAQVVAVLVRNGLLTSERGRGGGVRSAARPETIPLAEVIRLTQPELVCDTAGMSRFHESGTPALDAIMTASATFFAQLIYRFTIADLLATSSEGRIACLDCGLINPARRSRAPEARSSNALPQRYRPFSAALPPNANRFQPESTDRHALRTAV